MRSLGKMKMRVSADRAQCACSATQRLYPGAAVVPRSWHVPCISTASATSGRQPKRVSRLWSSRTRRACGARWRSDRRRGSEKIGRSVSHQANKVGNCKTWPGKGKQPLRTGERAISNGQVWGGTKNQMQSDFLDADRPDPYLLIWNYDRGFGPSVLSLILEQCVVYSVLCCAPDTFRVDVMCRVSCPNGSFTVPRQ